MIQKKYHLYLFLSFLFLTTRILSQNTVMGPKIAPGILIGEEVVLPEIKLKDAKDFYSKSYRVRPSQRLLNVTIESSIQASVFFTVKFTCEASTDSCRYTSATTSDDDKDAKREIYVTQNFEQLEIEMAQGKGERLSTLSTLYGCPDELSADFGRMTQKKYKTIFHNLDGLTSSSFIKRIKQEVRNDKILGNGCKVT